MNSIRLAIGISALLVVAALILSINADTNTGLFLWINQLANYTPGIFWLNVTNFGDALVVVSLAILLLWKDRSKLATLLLTALVIAVVIFAFKNTLAIDRPPFVLSPGAFNDLLGDLRPDVYSMPSGHTASVFALMMVGWISTSSIPLRTILLLIS